MKHRTEPETLNCCHWSTGTTMKKHYIFHWENWFRVEKVENLSKQVENTFKILSPTLFEYPEPPQRSLQLTGEVQTNEEAQVYVHDSDLFVTVQILEDTPAVLSLGKIFENNGYLHEWTSGQKPHLIKNDRKPNAIRKTVCRSLSQDFQPILPVRLQVLLQHRYRWTKQKIPRQVQRPYDVEVPAGTGRPVARFRATERW